MAVQSITERPLIATEPSVAARPVQATRERAGALDNLKILLTVLVIGHHAGQAYGPTGGDWPIFNDERARILGPFFSVNAAFFMGLFFLIAGYLTPATFDRKGLWGFLRDRALRLGLPLAFVGLALFGPVTYYTEYAGSPGATEDSFWGYFFRVYLGQGQFEIGHLWFVAHLLVYAVAYAGWRLIRRDVRPDRAPLPVPGYRAIAAYTVALALATTLVRIWFPQDRWVRPFGLPIEPAHLPQYASLFIIGIVAANNDWLRRIPRATGIWLFAVGLIAGALVYLDRLTGGLLPISAAQEPLIWGTWESIISVGLSVGLPVVAREYFNRQGALLRGLTGNAYATYLLHVWPIVGLQFALADATLPPLVKFAIVCAFGIPLSFGIGWLVRRLPGVRRVL